MDDPRSDWQRRMGVGERQITSPSARKPTRTTTVTADDGPLRGNVVGAKREHKSGRVDAAVTRPTLTVNPNLVARKVPS